MRIEKIVIASGNQHKIKEIAQIFKGIEIVSMKELGFFDDIVEDGNSFKENAYIKAKTVCDKLHLPSLADDSGICVAALGGKPGIYSARYSGGDDEDNNNLLLKNLNGKKDRSAWYECVVCLCLPDGQVFYGEGKTEGVILKERHGTNGFGYDPLFFSNELQKCFGEVSAEEKNSVSHRSRALKALLRELN